MYQNAEKETYCRWWYCCPDSITIRLNFVDEPMYTLRSTPSDTYSHFNVELLLITVSFFHLFIFARLFSLVVLAPSRLFTKISMLWHRLGSSPPLCRVWFQSHSPKKSFLARTNFLERDDYTTAISPGKAKRWAECVH